VGTDVQAEKPGRISPRRISLSYQLALVACAVVMLLLPAIYLGFVVGLVWCLQWYAIHAALFFSNGGWLMLLCYIGPLVAGGMLVLFMVKPLFARPAKKTPPLEIKLAEEPKLRNYIREISTAVGVSMPRRVFVDNQLNASASFRHGWLGLLRRDLDLTIGLPLVSGLKADELASVIAHEFGHFAQTGGMTASFVIRSVNGWFFRVVFQRDRLDAWLDLNSRQGDYRVVLILRIAGWGIWAGRKLLQGLMIAGHAVTCNLLRQMEYDADACAVQACGVEPNLGVERELGLLGVCLSRAYEDLNAMWREKRLVDDFPALVQSRRLALDPRVSESLEKAADDEKPAWNQTHPTRRQRERAARALGSAGILHHEGMASDVFEDYPGLCRRVTLHFFREELKLDVDPQRLVSAQEAAQIGNQDMLEAASAERLLAHGFDIRRPLLLPARNDAIATRLNDFSRTLQQNRELLSRDREAFIRDQKSFDLCSAERENVLGAEAFLETGMKVQPASFGLSKSSLEEARRKRKACDEKLAALATVLRPADEAVVAWLLAAEGAAAALVERETPCREAARSLLGLAALYRSLTPLWASLPKLGDKHRQMILFRQNAPAAGNSVGFAHALVSLRENIEQMIGEGMDAQASREYPFSTTKERMTLGAYFQLMRKEGDEFLRAHNEAQAVYDLHIRLLRRLVWLGEQIEREIPALVCRN
jgi:Zn-dependent protease with chaperone function